MGVSCTRISRVSWVLHKWSAYRDSWDPYCQPDRFLLQATVPAVLVSRPVIDIPLQEVTPDIHVKQAVTSWLQVPDIRFFCAGIHALGSRREKWLIVSDD